ncbi:MAG TPA: FAD/NAD(P)-binding protein [Coxiellaceae bacterium]|nr:MAG: hypothetical protein A3E81_06835 [Gammaproteobacteria bacterium RIFCSPHIGHO2_12_FULL_36_30]HLB56459.1 FAD/NAD(P)-binding protein [Coxiellaceae bacterium]
MLFRDKHVGIIGGGASGIFALCYLIDLKIEADDLLPLQITLIEKNEILGEGMAYRSDHQSNLLNTAAGLFSGMNDDQRPHLKNQPSFLKWVRENQDAWAAHCPTLMLSDITKNSYLPRCLVGIYLRHILHFYTDIARKYNTTIHFLLDEVQDINFDVELGWEIVLSYQKTLSFSHVILAIGGFLKNNFQHLHHADNYFNNPWPNKNNLKKILSCKTVGIIGTKLSALDTAGILRSHHYSGKIVMASRSGFLPSVKNVHHVYNPILLTTDTLHHLNRHGDIKLNDVINLVKSEIEYASGKKIAWKKIEMKKRFSMSWLYWQINMAKNPAVLWQSVLASASDFFISAWHCLNPQEKLFFTKHFAQIWETYRFSMPLCTANEIVNLIQSEQLNLFSDVSHPEIHNKKIILKGFDSFKKKFISIETDFLINATGINYDVNSISSSLLKNILQRGIAKANPYGGINVNFNSFAVSDFQTLYAIGDLTKGTQFFTNSYLVCSDQAATVAKSILLDCEQNNFMHLARFNVEKTAGQSMYAH